MKIGGAAELLSIIHILTILFILSKILRNGRHETHTDRQRLRLLGR